jgi:hypothetical protein
MLGQAKLALCFQIPSQASLHGILKSIAHFAAQIALRLRLAQKLLGENAGLRLPSKRGCVVKKHLQARLRVSFQQHIQHSHSESTTVFSIFLFDSFAPAHLALLANLRLLYRAPAPALGCVYLGNPWLKFFSREEAQSPYSACGSGGTSSCVAGGAWWRRTVADGARRW